MLLQWSHYCISTGLAVRQVDVCMLGLTSGWIECSMCGGLHVQPDGIGWFGSVSEWHQSVLGSRDLMYRGISSLFGWL